MTIGDVIKKLQTFDPNLPAVRRLDEFSGAADINTIELIPIKLNVYNNHPTKGEHVYEARLMTLTDQAVLIDT